jgi:hypothetical protein
MLKETISHDQTQRKRGPFAEIPTIKHDTVALLAAEF